MKYMTQTQVSMLTDKEWNAMYLEDFMILALANSMDKFLKKPKKTSKTSNNESTSQTVKEKEKLQKKQIEKENKIPNWKKV